MTAVPAGAATSLAWGRRLLASIALILSTLGQQAHLPPRSNVQVFEGDGGAEGSSEEDDSEGDGNGESSSGVKRGGKRRRADFVMKFHLLSAPNRFQFFGADELGHQDRRDKRRSVQAPVRFSANKGKGALPIAPAPGVRIYLSGTTLVIVPDALVDQWVRQLGMHTERSALRVKIISNQKCVPSASELAFDYDVVVVDFKVISSVLSEARAGNQPSFLRVRFLRVVMDEGHKLGSTSKQVSNFARVSEMLRAERRWILTGTPAARAFDGDLSTLVPLLKFIREGAFGAKGEEDAWKIAVQKPYYSKHPDALAVLGELLNRVMIRSLKKNVVGIPGCTIRNVFLAFTIDGAKSYNALVSTFKRNLVLFVSNSKKSNPLHFFLSRLARMSLLTFLYVLLHRSDWFSPAHKESLLNKKNQKWSAEMFERLQNACNIGAVFQTKVEDYKLGSSLWALHDLALKNSASSSAADTLKVAVKEEDKCVSRSALMAGDPSFGSDSSLAFRSSNSAVLLASLTVPVVSREEIEAKEKGAAKRRANRISKRLAPFELPFSDGDISETGSGLNALLATMTCSDDEAVETESVACEAEADRQDVKSESPLCMPRRFESEETGESVETGSHYQIRGILKNVGRRLLDGCICQTCGKLYGFPILSTCFCIVCVDCYASSKAGCTVPSFKHKYVLDDDGIPKDVHGLQPYVGSLGKEDWNDDRNVKMQYLLGRLEQLPDISGKRPKVVLYSGNHEHRLLLSWTFKNSEQFSDRYLELYENAGEWSDTQVSGHGDIRKKKETASERIVRMVETFRSGAGGQHIVTMDTSTRQLGSILTLFPTCFCSIL